MKKTTKVRREYAVKERPSHLQAVQDLSMHLAYGADFLLEAHGYASGPYMDDPEPDPGAQRKEWIYMHNRAVELLSLLAEIES